MKVAENKKAEIESALAAKGVKDLVLQTQKEERASMKGYAITKSIEKKRYVFNKKLNKFV